MFERLTDSRPCVLEQSKHTFVYAVGGDHIGHLMLRLGMAKDEHVFKGTTRFIIMVGINNILNGEGVPHDIACAIQQLVDHVDRLSLATTAIYVCTLLKTMTATAGRYQRSPAQASQVNRYVDELNLRIRTLKRCTVINMDVPANSVNLLDDGLHLTTRGMKTMMEQLPLQSRPGHDGGLGESTVPGMGNFSLKPKKNQAGQFATKIMKAESALGDPHLQRDYHLLTSGHAIYHTEFLSPKNDFSLMVGLVNDLEANAGKITNYTISW